MENVATGYIMTFCGMGLLCLMGIVLVTISSIGRNNPLSTKKANKLLFSGIILLCSPLVIATFAYVFSFIYNTLRA